MLYYLFKYLQEINVPGAGVFKYISFRAPMAGILSLLIALIIGKVIIRWLQKQQIGETIRELGLEGQMQKKGTPTMGGIIILLSLLVPSLLLCRLDNPYVWVVLGSVAWMGIIGAIDDYIKVFKKNKEGLKATTKLIGQFVLGAIIAVAIDYTHSAQNIDLKTNLPFFIPGANPDDGFNFTKLIPGEGNAWLIYVPFIVLVCIAVTNAVNLTDGIDGLASGTTAIVGGGLGIFAYAASNQKWADYLNIIHVPQSDEIVVILAALIGSCLGFLWYNGFPAQVFMGDTGSLALGGAVAAIAIIIKVELFLPILCGVFFAESLSVVLQVSWFKYTRKKYGEGRRIFLMSPLHHHYQKKNIPESKITLRFWLITILLVLGTIALMKLR